MSVLIGGRSNSLLRAATYDRERQKHPRRVNTRHTGRRGVRWKGSGLNSTPSIEFFDCHSLVTLQIECCWKDTNLHEPPGFGMGRFISLWTIALCPTVQSQVKRSELSPHGIPL